MKTVRGRESAVRVLDAGAALEASQRLPHPLPLRLGRVDTLKRVRKSGAAHRGQQGFSLIEVSIVTAIVLLIAVIGIPTIGGYVMENKVPKVGQELARFVMNMRINAETSPERPYESISTASLSAIVADSTVLAAGENGAVLHGLGAKGTVEVESQDGGETFVLRLHKVNHVACPSLASVLQRVADRITVGPEGRIAVVKDDEGDVLYSALAAEAACESGNVNEFAFYVS